MTVSITKPTVGGSQDTWGTTINTALDDIVDVLNGATAMTPDLTSFDIGGVPVTATAAEINYVDGVTSNIQTQLDAKQGLDATLTALAGTLTAADKIPYATALDTAGELDFLDEDDMASDSATAVPSQQSVKAYVNSRLAEFAIFRNEQTSGTSGAALTASSWTTHNVNTSSYNNISGASLASKQITLPAGTYKLSGWGGANTTFNTSGKSDRFKPRLRNITDGTTTIVGGNGLSSGYSGTLADGHQIPLNGVFTIATTKVFELQMYASGGGNATEGFPFGSGEVEVYAELVFEKIA